MKIRIIAFIAVSFLSYSVHAMYLNKFEAMVRQYAATTKNSAQGPLTRKNIIDAYDKFKQHIHKKLADQGLKVLLNKTIAQLRAEEARQQQGPAQNNQPKPLSEMDEFLLETLGDSLENEEPSAVQAPTPTLPLVTTSPQIAAPQQPSVAPAQTAQASPRTPHASPQAQATFQTSTSTDLISHAPTQLPKINVPQALDNQAQAAAPALPIIEVQEPEKTPEHLITALRSIASDVPSIPANIQQAMQNALSPQDNTPIYIKDDTPVHIEAQEPGNASPYIIKRSSPATLDTPATVPHETALQTADMLRAMPITPETATNADEAHVAAQIAVQEATPSAIEAEDPESILQAGSDPANLIHDAFMEEIEDNALETKGEIEELQDNLRQQMAEFLAKRNERNAIRGAQLQSLLQAFKIAPDEQKASYQETARRILTSEYDKSNPDHEDFCMAFEITLPKE